MWNDQVDLSLINKFSHDLIIKHLCQNEGHKNIILSKDLPRIIDGIVKYSELKEQGLNKLYFLDEKLMRGPQDKNFEWIYIVRPEVENLKMICKQINNDIRLSAVSRYPYKILFAPRKLFICDLIFEQEGIYEYVVQDELENDLIQLDNDILSMEFPRFYTNYFLNGDQSWFSSIAKSLINIQDWFGTIPNIHLHGNCAKGVYELINRLNDVTANNNVRSSHAPENDYKIGHLLLLDRNVDNITPFCSPLIYEGLMDESFSINAGYVDLPEIEGSKKKRIKLSNDDKVFEQIRTMHISEVFGYLKNIVNYLNEVKDKRNDLNSISDLKEFISSDLKDYQKYKESVILYLNMSETIISQKTHAELQTYLTAEHRILTSTDYRKSFEYIEELINRNYDINQVIRLMILLSKTNDGLSVSDYNQLTTQFVQNYGHDKVFLLQKLQRMGLFECVDVAVPQNDSKSNLLRITSEAAGTKKFVQHFATKLNFSTNYSSIVKKLHIIPGELSPSQLKSDSKNTDLSYAFNGQYRPILCKYISQILFPDDTRSSFEEITKLLPGDYEYKSKGNFSVRNRESNSLVADKVVLIFFLGGCTYTEIAVLKKLAKQKGYTFIFATTSFLNTKEVVNLLV